MQNYDKLHESQAKRIALLVNICAFNDESLISPRSDLRCCPWIISRPEEWHRRKAIHHVAISHHIHTYALSVRNCSNRKRELTYKELGYIKTKISELSVLIKLSTASTSFSKADTRMFSKIKVDYKSFVSSALKFSTDYWRKPLMFLLVSKQNGPKSINRLHFIQRYFNTVRFVEQLVLN